MTSTFKQANPHSPDVGFGVTRWIARLALPAALLGCAAWTTHHAIIESSPEQYAAYDPAGLAFPVSPPVEHHAGDDYYVITKMEDGTYRGKIYDQRPKEKFERGSFILNQDGSMRLFMLEGGIFDVMPNGSVTDVSKPGFPFFRPRTPSDTTKAAYDAHRKNLIKLSKQ